VEFVEDDWRNISGRYDVFVSVGMLEHVGIEKYPLLGDVIHRSLKDPGMALIHTIGKNVAGPLNTWIERRIFPGAAPPSLKQMMNIFEGWNYSILDVENLRLHYAQTLRHWLQRFEEHVDTIEELYDEEFVRTWRLYLAGSVAAFMTGTLQLFQVVFTQADNNNIAWTRASLYQQEHDSFESSSFTGHQR
jgi:cyclopropane-fatty-acyl-phospholipid synthase